MREILFKHLTSVSSRKKDIVLKEAFEKDGIATKVERRCFYFIKDIQRFGDEKGLQSWFDLHGVEQNKAANKRQFHIYKEHSEIHGTDKIICKIIGTFYAVVGTSIYTIVFLHAFKANFTREIMSK